MTHLFFSSFEAFIGYSIYFYTGRVSWWRSILDGLSKMFKTFKNMSIRRRQCCFTCISSECNSSRRKSDSDTVWATCVLLFIAFLWSDLIDRVLPGFRGAVPTFSQFRADSDVPLLGWDSGSSSWQVRGIGSKETIQFDIMRNFLKHYRQSPTDNIDVCSIILRSSLFW